MDKLESLRQEILNAGHGAEGPLLYRGESAEYPDVSSTLRRRCSGWRRTSESALGDFNSLQRTLTQIADKHDNPAARQPRPSDRFHFLWSGGYDPTEMSEKEVELMGELQHWGAATNLIDFTRDVDVAIYFACEEKWECDGRVLIVREQHVAGWRLDAKTPQHRAATQKSVFLRPPEGTVTPWQQVTVKRNDKPLLLDQLSQSEPPITPLSLYKDVFGYVRLSDRYVEGMDYYHEGFELVERHRETTTAGRTHTELLDKAKSLLVRASEKLFWVGGVWAELGRAHLFAREFDHAEEMLTKAHRLGFRTASTHGMLGTIAHLAGQNELALQFAREGLALCDGAHAGSAKNESERQSLEEFIRIVTTGEVSGRH